LRRGITPRRRLCEMPGLRLFEVLT